MDERFSRRIIQLRLRYFQRMMLQKKKNIVVAPRIKWAKASRVYISYVIPTIKYVCFFINTHLFLGQTFSAF